MDTKWKKKGSGKWIYFGFTLSSGGSLQFLLCILRDKWRPLQFYRLGWDVYYVSYCRV